MSAWEAIFSAWMPDPGGDPAYRAAMESVVREENRDRRQLYKMIAEKNNQTREVIAARAAIRFAERAKTGEYLMQNGEWRKKQ